MLHYSFEVLFQKQQRPEIASCSPLLSVFSKEVHPNLTPTRRASFKKLLNLKCSFKKHICTETAPHQLLCVSWIFFSSTYSWNWCFGVFLQHQRPDTGKVEDFLEQWYLTMGASFNFQGGTSPNAPYNMECLIIRNHGLKLAIFIVH